MDADLQAVVRDSSPAVCAVMVTYHPGPDLEDNLQAIQRECTHVIVVDNGSGDATRTRLQAVQGIEVIALPENLGVAAALNRATQRALERRMAWMVTFDQDSQPSPGFMAALWAAQRRFPQAAVIGPNIEEPTLTMNTRWVRPHPRCGWWFQRTECRADLESVTMVVTSGALTELAFWATIGGFDERLFIDFVDTDYCLRCREAGRTIVVSYAAKLRHRLGARETRTLAGIHFHPTHHSPLRHYYIARNRMPMLRRHAWRQPHWFFYECGVFSLWLFRILAFEDKKIAKLRAIVRGTLTGLRGATGRAPENLASSLEGGGAQATKY